jgi:hypothetical protein
MILGDRHSGLFLGRSAKRFGNLKRLFTNLQWREIMALRAALIIAVLGCVAPSFASDCVECHRQVTPNIVVDWELSKHHEADVDCSICHGEDHSSADDVELVQLPTNSSKGASTPLPGRR